MMRSNYSESFTVKEEDPFNSRSVCRAAGLTLHDKRFAIPWETDSRRSNDETSGVHTDKRGRDVGAGGVAKELPL
jgi:hypothetical protein